MLGSIVRGLGSVAPMPPPAMVRREARGFSASLATQSWGGGNIPQPEGLDEYQAAYETLVVVYRCASLNASAVSAGVLRFYRDNGDGTRIELTDRRDPLVQLFRRPNPQTSGRRWIWRHQLAKELTGNAYQELVTGKARQLWYLNPAKMKVLADAKRGVYGYDYAGTTFAPASIWHDKYPSPTDEIYGLSPERPAARHIGANEALEKAVNAILKNGMRLGGVLSLEADIAQEAVDAIRADLTALHAGASNWGKSLVVPGGRDFKALNMQPESFQANEVRKYNTGMIMRAFGVWPLIFGDVDTSATRENATTQAILQHFLTTLPRAIDVQDEITERLIPALGFGREYESVFAEFDFSQTYAVRSLSLDEARGARELVESNILERNEVRDILGYDPVDWGADPRASGLSADPVALPRELRLGSDSARTIVQSVADGRIPRETGIHLLVSFLSVDDTAAEAIMGDVGRGFVPISGPAAPEPAVAAGEA